MSNVRWTRYAGDINDHIICVVTGIDGNLDGVAAVTASVTDSDDLTSTVALAASVHDSANFKVKVELDTWLQSTAVKGKSYILRIQMTGPDFGPSTWPDRGLAVIDVK